MIRKIINIIVSNLNNMLGSKTLGLNVLELQFEMLTNRDQNV